MMKNAMKALGVLGLGSLLIAAAPAWAEPTLEYSSDNYGDFLLDPFGGFDFTDQGSAVTFGFVPDGTTIFTTYFMSAANEINQADGGAFTIDGLRFGTAGGPADGYEFTIYAEIQETALCLTAGCTVAQFTAVGGTFAVYYQPTGNANLTTGTGITDGELVFSGTILAGEAGLFSTGTNSGNFLFNAVINFTNNDFINPDLAAALAVSTIQFGTATTGGWTAPTSFVDSGQDISNASFVFQADANLDVAIPEPHIIGLLGLGLLALGAVHRRRFSRMG